MRPTSVALLLGGPSAEHDVSLVSGRAIAAALAERGHVVEGWLIDLATNWWQLPAPAMDGGIAATSYDDPAGLGARGPFGAAAALEALASRAEPPVVFIALHGPYGEDGTVQALCEAAGLTYTGASVAASALGMDKTLFKRLAEAQGMPVVPWTHLEAAEWRADPAAIQRRVVEFAREQADARLMVKPARLGSSVGISIVHRPDDPEYLGGAISDAFSFCDSVLVEAYLDHPREFEVSVLGNTAAGLESYGPGEIFPGREFYDYVAKYSDGVSSTTDSPELEPALRATMHEIARRAYLAIGATGFARVDFLFERGVDGRLFLNEINTIPGFTPISLFPVLCRAGGYDFGAVSERIIELALERRALQSHRALTRADLP